jgi:hypothetical protein
MFLFILLSNVCNYISIASNSWVSAYPAGTPNGGLTYSRYKVWDLDVTTIALVVTGTAFNIISLVFGLASLIAALSKFLRDLFAVIFIIGTLASSLLALVFNSSGWYYFLSTLNIIQQNKQPNIAFLTRFDWGFWLLVPAFGFSVLGAVCASSIVGCSAGSVKSSKREDYSRKNNLAVYEKNNESLPRTPEPQYNQQMTQIAFQNDTFQSEANVLRL